MEILEIMNIPYYKKGKGIRIKKKNRGWKHKEGGIFKCQEGTPRGFSHKAYKTGGKLIKRKQNGVGK